MRFRSQTLAHAAFCLGALQLVLSSCRMRPSSVPLGGVHVDEAELPSAKRVAANATPAALPAAPPEPSSEPQHAE
ncbi:MAG TPA: hypothetical protein VEQ59_04020, partial [Polyangiaceae bacterium]|nr:hypothetical protein [Polyangiaceae bacterium]